MVLSRVQHDFHIDPIILPCQFIFQPFVTWLRENYDYRNVGNTAVESFLSNAFFIISFCSDLSCRWNCLSCRIGFISCMLLFTYANNLAHCIKLLPSFNVLLVIIQWMDSCIPKEEEEEEVAVIIQLVSRDHVCRFENESQMTKW